ncbi:TPA: AAA family ATPase [Photobacterium damselae]
MKIKKVEIQAFKGYLKKEDSTFDFMINDEPAKLVAIHAPNGYGKTSFYDAIDYAITNNIHRYIRIPSIRTLNNKLSSDQIHDSGYDFSSKLILRNINNPDKLNTTINVDTTIENFNVSISADKATRDYIFDPNKTPKDRKFFEKIILSQEAIDGYIRESRPEQRYIDFIECQSDDIKELESSRSELYQAISDVTSMKTIIEDKLNLLKKESIDSHKDSIVKENFTKYVNELIQLGIELPSFEGVEHNKIKEQIEMVLNNKLYLMEEKNKSLNEEKEIIKKEISKYHAEYIKSFRDIKILSLEKNTVLCNKNNYENYQLLTKKIFDENLDLGLKVKLKNEVDEYKEKIPAYIKAKLNVTSLIKSNEEKYRQIKELSAVNTKLNKIIDNSKEIINNGLSYINVLQRKRDGLDGNYLKLNELINKKNALIEKSNKDNSELSLNESKVTEISETISKIKNIDFISNGWENRLQELALITSDDYELILSNKTKLQNIQIEENKLKQSASNLKENEEELKILQGYGLTYLSKVSNSNISNCPLCYSSFGNHEKLCESIQNNEYLKDFIDPIYQKNLVFRKEKDAINSSTNEIVQRYELLMLQCLSENQLILNDLLSEKEKIKEIISKNGNALHDIDKQIFDLFSITQGKDKDTNIKDINSEIIRYKNSHDKLHKIIDNHNLTIIANNEEIFTIESLISNNNEDLKELSLVKEFEDFLITKLSIELNSIIEDDVKTIFSDNLSILNKSCETMKEYIDNLELKKDKLSQQIENYLRLSEKDAFESFNNVLTELNSKINNEKMNIDSIYSILPINIQSDVFEMNEDDLSSILNQQFDEKSLEYDNSTKISLCLRGLLNLLEVYSNYIKVINIDAKIKNEEEELGSISSVLNILNDDVSSINTRLKKKIDSYFYSELVNQIYSKIDPHPGFKKVVFECTFSDNDKPKLNVYLTNDESSAIISPNIYLSSAQISVLSLSIFMARALHSEKYKGNTVDCILIDDPVQSMDSINVLSVIDLFRNLAVTFDKQIIISTHDERFYKLFKAKVPKNISKFLELESHGKVKAE